MESHKLILVLSCKDRAGIVASVSTFLHQNSGFIITSAQHGDPSTDKFFMRAEFNCPENPEVLSDRFKKIAEIFKMQFSFFDKNKKQNVLIAVTKESHCLTYLLHKWEAGNLNANIVGIVSNHEVLKPHADRFNLDFHHLPISDSSDEAKKDQESKFKDLIEKTNTDLVVLARYMQVLSNDLCSSLRGRAINIHHSFLPGFKGAKPYHQAFDRGVKIIGATSHYVTQNLDEGPIIEQEVTRVDHSHAPKDLKFAGEDIENRVLFRAVKWHLEHKIILNGDKTVIFY